MIKFWRIVSPIHRHRIKYLIAPLPTEIVTMIISYLKRIFKLRLINRQWYPFILSQLKRVTLTSTLKSTYEDYYSEVKYVCDMYHKNQVVYHMRHLTKLSLRKEMYITIDIINQCTQLKVIKLHDRSHIFFKKADQYRIDQIRILILDNIKVFDPQYPIIFPNLKYLQFINTCDSIIKRVIKFFNVTEVNQQSGNLFHHRWFEINTSALYK